MQHKPTWNIHLLAALALILGLGLSPARPGLAYSGPLWFSSGPLRFQAGSAMDLVNAVNAYRAQYGLQPYSVDGGLMAAAQSQSDYQASIGACTHTGANGSSPAARGVAAENIACGPGMTPNDAINGQWTDQVHQSTLVGPETGTVGAGVAEANGLTYYTLDVNLGSGAFVARAAVQPASAGQADPPTATAAISIYIPPDFATSTPNSDGSIAHVLQYGETLVEIAQAYGISLPDLIAMNHLDPQKPVYFAGQVLIVRNAFTPTPFVTNTFTPRPPTRTPLPTRTLRPTRTAPPPQTPLPSPTATRPPLFRAPTLDDLGPVRPVMAYGFIIVCGVGLIVLIITSFLPARKS